MKIEIGESLLQSYLKNVKECILTQTNWKTAASWKTEKYNFEKAEYLFNRIQNHNDFSDVFKKSSLEQALKQAELDVVGTNNEKLYMIEVAFHENGLQYGGRLETKDRGCKKLLRAYLIGLAYFPNYKYEIIFASPKVNPATDETIRDYFSVLNKDFSDDEKVEFKYIANDDFEKEILVPTIQATLADSDSSELFLRSVKMLELFNMVKLNSSATTRSFGSTPADLPTQRQNYSYMQSPSFGSKDATQFMVNGSPAGGKGPTVYAAVKYYVESHSGISFGELQNAFPDNMARPGFGKMVRRWEEVTSNEWSGSRFNKHPIFLSDGTRIAVSTQWKPDNMQSFIVGAQRLGIEIKPLS